MWLCSVFDNGPWILFGNLDGWIPKLFAVGWELKL